MKTDFRIKFTIKEIVEDFFENYQAKAILLIHYDNSDGKEIKRFKCFARWFNELHQCHSFHKEDTEIMLPDESEVKVSVILKLEHNMFQRILQEFHETKTRFIDEGYKNGN